MNGKQVKKLRKIFQQEVPKLQKNTLDAFIKEAKGASFIQKLKFCYRIMRGV